MIVLGLCGIFGALLIWGAFDPGPGRGMGLGLVLVGGVGAVGVGVFPETTPVLNGGMHEIVSAIAFVGAGLGLVALSFAMARGPHWRLSRRFTLGCGLLTLVATVLLELDVYVGLGPGGMERLVVAPILLWAVVEGVHIARLPRFAPRSPFRVSPG